uniref:Protein TIC 214 n=1 Tax=Heterorhabditis bacteriophora TaxID=37862 RepID=A0A1I7WK03_HETBA
MNSMDYQDVIGHRLNLRAILVINKSGSCNTKQAKKQIFIINFHGIYIYIYIYTNSEIKYNVVHKITYLNMYFKKKPYSKKKRKKQQSVNHFVESINKNNIRHITMNLSFKNTHEIIEIIPYHYSDLKNMTEKRFCH